MRIFALYIVLVFPLLTHAENDLAGITDDRERTIYCYYASTVQLQLHGALMTDRNDVEAMLQSTQRWQDLVSRQTIDPVTQQSAMQEATLKLTQRMQAAGGNPRTLMDEVIAPTMAACDGLLASLDTVTVAAAAPDTSESIPQSISTGVDDSDVFGELLQAPLNGQFRWNPHSTIYASVRTSGAFSRIQGSSSAYKLDFASNITTLCVGELIESHRSDDGYLMHLKVKPDTGDGCEPRVTRGLLFPMALDDTRSGRRLMLRLYDDLGRLITSSRFNSKPVENKHLDQEQLLAMAERVRQLDANNDTKRRGEKLSNLKMNADFARLEPFYDSCMGTAPSINGVMGSSDYCLCMTYKFGMGERIPEAEFVSYIQDFSRLVDRVKVFNADNKLYTRLSETCRSCSSPSGALHPGCDEMDAHLLMPQTFAEMIKLLDKPVVNLESSTFFRENFFVIYLQGYSDFCASEVENAVPFDYVVTEYTTDPYAGTFSNEVQRDRTYVAGIHAPRYQQIYEKHSELSPEQFAASVRQMAITSATDLRRSQSDVSARIQSETEKRESVREHLESGCRSDSVQRVYGNLDALFQ